MAIQVYVLTSPEGKVLAVFGDILTGFKSLASSFREADITFKLDGGKVTGILPNGKNYNLTPYKIVENPVRFIDLVGDNGEKPF